MVNGIKTRADDRDDTRERLLAAAHEQFAERGFYGASIAQIAGELGLTKQALLYHFKRKEDLYREVLSQIAKRLSDTIEEVMFADGDPRAQFENFILKLHANGMEDPQGTRILMRELLDNRARAEKAKDWFLRQFLEDTLALLQKIEGLENLPFEEAFALLYQLLGGIEYFTISEVTLRQMYGDGDYEKVRARYPDNLRSQIRRMIDSAAV